MTLEPPGPETTNRPTQVRYPWRATVRTTIVAGIALLPLLPDMARAAGIETVPAVVTILAGAAAVQRVIAVPGVDRWLRDHGGILSTAPPGDPQAIELDDSPGKHRMKP